jgi:hypothetical protein
VYRLEATGWKRPREFRGVLADRIRLRGMVKWGVEKGATRFRRKLSRPGGMLGANRPQLVGN